MTDGSHPRGKVDLQQLWAKVLAESASRAHALHGPDHWARVERNGLYLARRCGGDELVVRLFALFHDCMRLNEGHDPDHGRRASAYACSIDDQLPGLSSAQLETLCVACDGHTEQTHSDDRTVGACWDADRLDIGRAGLVPEVAFFNCAAAKELVHAKSLRALEEIPLRAT